MAIPAEQPHSYARGARAPYTWSARFSLEQPSSLEDVVNRQLGGLVTGFADPEWPISGAVHGGGDAEDRTAVVLGQVKLWWTLPTQTALTLMVAKSV